ncbi:hypothetical protein CLOM_g17252 [Closterium sp. NIES-68]|nr:hypothetical protein CLOM_g17252 [Closterium sp. NIES-68]
MVGGRWIAKLPSPGWLMASAWLLAGVVIGWCSWELTAGAQNGAADSGSSAHEKGARLYETWASAYGLDGDSPHPRPSVSLSPDLPPAPHLEDCAARSAFRLSSEEWGSSRQWALSAAEDCQGIPQPPWVRGSDVGNLGGTRAAQRDIWERQFPPHACRGRKLLLVRWPPLPPQLNSTSWAGGEGGHGSVGDSRAVGFVGVVSGDGGGAEREWMGEWLAAVVGVMSEALAVAVSSGRVLVPMPGSFGPAMHDACRAHEAWGSWQCYFFPMASPDCESAAMATLEAAKGKNSGMEGRGGKGEGSKGGAESEWCKLMSNAGGDIASEEQVVCVVVDVGSAWMRWGGSGGVGNGGRSRGSGGGDCDGDGSGDGGGGDGAVACEGQHPAEDAAAVLGTAWQQQACEEGGEGCAYTSSDRQKKHKWWKAQSVRFMLRWPSLHLCHLVNRERHQVYGLHVARGMVVHEAERASILSAMLARFSLSRLFSEFNHWAEGQRLSSINFTAPGTVETAIWPAVGFEGCVGRGEGNITGSESGALHEYLRVGKEAYILRPIVSMHVTGKGPGVGVGAGRVRGQEKSEQEGREEWEEERQGQVTLNVSMFHAYGFQQRHPGLKHAWLTTESMNVVQHLSTFYDWEFLYSRTLQGNRTEGEGEGEAPQGPSTAGAVGLHLANVLIASEADYFVGSLNSQQASLILTLKATNGRLRSHVALLR